MLAVRAPGLLNLEELNISPPLFQEIVHFIYTNNPLNFKNMKPTDILQIIHFCKSVRLMELVPSCKEALVPSLTKKNVFEAASECHSLHLTDELNCIAWFIRKNKLTPPPEISNQSLLTKLKPTYAKKLISPLLSPRFASQVRPLDDVMEVLYSTKVYSDFTIKFKNTIIKVHKFVLASRWPYFTNIMLKDHSLTVHNGPMPLDTFVKFIQFFYVGVKNLTLRDCGWILYLSEFYLLHDEKPLLKYCDQMVNAQIQHLPSAFQLAMEIDHKHIEQKAISMIPTTIKPKIVVSMCMGFVKGQQQRLIQEQQKAVQEHRRVLNDISSHLSKIESLLLNKTEELSQKSENTFLIKEII